MKISKAYLKKILEEEMQNMSHEEVHDHEGKMAKSELRDMVKNAQVIYKSFQEDDQLPGWVSAYITLASDYMHSVMEYMVEQNSDSDSIGDVELTDADDEEVME
jgi:phage gp37-like protein